MDFSITINDAIKEAMKQKNQARLRGLRAIKSALLLAQTEKVGAVVDEARAVQILQKLVKQRRDSMTIYKEQGRDDLFQIEQEELEVIESFLPAQMDPATLKSEIEAIIQEVGAQGMADLKKVMPVAMQRLAGKTDNKSISETIKHLLGA